MMGCYNSVTVDAPVDQVWDTLRKFHDFSWCPDVITQLEVVGDSGGTETGCQADPERCLPRDPAHVGR